MSQTKKPSKTVRVGKMLLSKAGTEYIALGDENPKTKKEYQYTVDVRITKANGEKIVLKNPTLFLNDPRKFSENPDKIPDFILSDVVFLKEPPKA